MAGLDTRIPLQVPNVLAQGAQVAQTNALRQQSLGQGFDAVQNGMAAPLRRNVLAQQGQSMNLDNTAQEQAMLGNVLEKVAQAPETWGQARDFLVQNGVFQQGELPDQLTEEAFKELSVIAFTPPEQLTDMQRYSEWMQNGTPEQQRAAKIYFDLEKGANDKGTSININTGEQVPELGKLPAGLVYIPDGAGGVKRDPATGAPLTATIGNTEADRKAREDRAATDAAISAGQGTISVIDQFLSHPGFDAMFGAASIGGVQVPIPNDILPNIPEGDAANAQPLLDQIKGKAFLEAFSSLKGGGSITEREGQAAAAAIARLGTRQSPESARQALGELRAIAQAGIEREIAKQAGIQSQVANPQPQQLPPVEEAREVGGKVYHKRGGKWFMQ